jgi:hypothetical protein
MDPVERVRNMVRHSLVAMPNVSNHELLARAREIAPSAVEGLSLLQFHARFRLPIIRRELGQRRKAENGTVKRRTPRAEIADAAPAEAQPNGSEPTPLQRRPRKGRKRIVAPAVVSDAAVAADIRHILVEFAVDLENAQARTDLIRVAGAVDRYAARILDALNNRQTEAV